MHTVLIVLLIGTLVASAASFVVMGVLQHLRASALARKAHEMGMRFSPEDPFDLPCALAEFALVSSGHSPRVDNVIYGRLDGRVVRAFDFRYEVGHGIQRLTRHYSVIAVESPQEVDSMLMWHEDDLQAAPVSLQLANRRLGQWLYEGSRPVAMALGEVCAGLGRPVSMETRGKAAMLFAPVTGSRRAYAAQTPDVAKIAAGIVEALSRVDRPCGEDDD